MWPRFVKCINSLFGKQCTCGTVYLRNSLFAEQFICGTVYSRNRFFATLERLTLRSQSRAWRARRTRQARAAGARGLASTCGCGARRRARGRSGGGRSGRCARRRCPRSSRRRTARARRARRRGVSTCWLRVGGGLRGGSAFMPTACAGRVREVRRPCWSPTFASAAGQKRAFWISPALGGSARARDTRCGALCWTGALRPMVSYMLT
jgi:hypothetical protein